MGVVIVREGFMLSEPPVACVPELSEDAELVGLDVASVWRSLSSCNLGSLLNVCVVMSKLVARMCRVRESSRWVSSCVQHWWLCIAVWD